ncbi:MAG: hydroxyethylthiazole kinase [bacterium]|nr:hydroxyethylthiazole kinase [bacterium]
MAHLGDHAAVLLAAVREQRPLVHHLANFVTMQAVASATRAVGALPVMAMAGDDAEEVAAAADALVLNLGTPTPERLEVMFAAGRVATVRGIPIVLDPVGAGATRYRTVAAGRLLDKLRVTVVRANPGEAAALLGRSGFVRGVESVGAGESVAGSAVESAGAGDAAALASTLARERGCVAAVSGACDHVADADRVLVVENGHPWLAVIPGAGCMVTGVIGAFCAAARSVADGAGSLLAAASALVCFGVAAEIAAGHARGPGTLAPALLDALYHLTPEQLRQAARVREI